MQLLLIIFLVYMEVVYKYEGLIFLAVLILFFAEPFSDEIKAWKGLFK